MEHTQDNSIGGEDTAPAGRQLTVEQSPGLLGLLADVQQLFHILYIFDQLTPVHAALY